MTEAQEKFFEKIDELGTGERAALRRSAGQLLRQADGRAVVAFYRCLPADVQGWEEDRWFAVACLRCLWDAGDQTGKPMEQVIAELIRAQALSDSTIHRVEILLDTEWDTDGYLLIKLTRMIKLIRRQTNVVNMDFAGLLEDLLRWNGESQTVQRKWARTIFNS